MNLLPASGQTVVIDICRVETIFSTFVYLEIAAPPTTRSTWDLWWFSGYLFLTQCFFHSNTDIPFDMTRTLSSQIHSHVHIHTCTCTHTYIHTYTHAHSSTLLCLWKVHDEYLRMAAITFKNTRYFDIYSYLSSGNWLNQFNLIVWIPAIKR